MVAIVFNFRFDVSVSGAVYRNDQMSDLTHQQVSTLILV
jgi:hypothetical protein